MPPMPANWCVGPEWWGPAPCGGAASPPCAIAGLAAVAAAVGIPPPPTPPGPPGGGPPNIPCDPGPAPMAAMGAGAGTGGRGRGGVGGSSSSASSPQPPPASGSSSAIVGWAGSAHGRARAEGGARGFRRPCGARGPSRRPAEAPRDPPTHQANRGRLALKQPHRLLRSHGMASASEASSAAAAATTAPDGAEPRIGQAIRATHRLKKIGRVSAGHAGPKVAGKLGTLAQRRSPPATPCLLAFHPCVMPQLELSTCTKIGRRKTQEVRRDRFARLLLGSGRLSSRNQRPSSQLGGGCRRSPSLEAKPPSVWPPRWGCAAGRRAGRGLRTSQDSRTRARKGRCRKTSVPPVKPALP